MKLDRTRRLLLGALTLLPLAAIAVLIGAMSVVFSSYEEKEAGRLVFSFFPLLFASVLVLNLLVYSLIAFYVYFIVKADGFSPLKKTLWIIAVFLGHVLAMPVFWFLHVRRSDDG